MRLLLCHPDYRTEMDLPKFIVVIRVPWGTVTLTKGWFVD